MLQATAIDRGSIAFGLRCGKAEIVWNIVSGMSLNDTTVCLGELQRAAPNSI